MRFNKIVFIRYLPLTKSIYTDLYFQDLLSNNYQVEYLDLVALFYPERVVTEEFNFVGTVKIRSYKELEEYFINNNRALYISIMTFEWRVFKLFRLITKYNLKLGVFARGVFPSSSKLRERYTIKRFLGVLSFSRISNFIKNKIALYAKKLRFIKSYDYLFKAGDYGYYGLGVGSEVDLKRAVIVEVNTVDYDQFLIDKGSKHNMNEDYIVFLDQYLPYHPDTRFFDIKTVEPEPYFNELNAFFDKIETITSKKVLIAAHPKAEKYLEINPFNKRDIYFNQSNDLVKGASLVLTHASTAISFPICYQKKIILLSSHYLNSILPQFLTTAEAIVNACGADLIYIDNNEELHISENFNLERYRDFMFKYLTSFKSENRLSKDILINFLNTND